MTGTIKRKIEKSNIGFIACEGYPRDLFFHKNSLEGVSYEDLREGDAVSFEVEDGPKGPSAIKVKKA